MIQDYLKIMMLNITIFYNNEKIHEFLSARNKIIFLYLSISRRIDQKYSTISEIS